MAKSIMQFRYYDVNAQKNYPSDITRGNLINGQFFENYCPITQLGIQSLPGTKFYLNDDGAITPVIIGSTGIYELNLEGLSEITRLSFDEDSIQAIESNSGAYLIIDIIYSSSTEEA